MRLEKLAGRDYSSTDERERIAADHGLITLHRAQERLGMTDAGFAELIPELKPEEVGRHTYVRSDMIPIIEARQRIEILSRGLMV